METKAEELEEIFDAYNDTVEGYSHRSIWEDENQRKRFNDWAGRDPSGKKVDADAFPWEGASDSAPPVIDSCIREDIDMCMVALDGARVEAHPIELGDTKTANTASTVLHYYIQNKMDGHDKEQELTANYWLERGKAAVGITWEREIAMAPTTYTIEKFAQMPIGVNAAGEPVVAAQIILDPSKEEEAIDMAIEFHRAECMRLVGEHRKDLKRSTAKKCIVDLRETGECKIPLPYFSLNAPCVTAYRYGYDIFRENQSLHIQKERRVFCREFLNCEQLKAGVAAYGWDQEWVDQVEKSAKGKISTLSYTDNRWSSYQSYNVSGSTNHDDHKDSYEIVHCYYKEADDDGVVTTKYIVFSPACRRNDRSELIYAIEEELTYEHGLLPFEDVSLEITSRNVSDSRGYGEVLGSAQRQIKVEVDSRADRASITTLPPLTYPHGRDPGPWGPGKRFPRMKADDYTFAPIPPYDRVSEIVEASAERQINRWLGRQDQTSDPVYSSLRKQRLTKKWLGFWKRVYTQVWSLIQQYCPPELVVRVTNDPTAQPIRVSREEIQGEFDLKITFNALSFDLEVRKQNLEYLGQILGMDAAGVIDRAAAVNVALQIVDPQIAAAIVRPAESVTQNEIEDTKRVYANIFAGLQEDIKPGQNYDLRLKVMNQILFGKDPDTGADSNPTAVKRLQADEDFRNKLEHYMKQLNHQLEQQRNAQIGRLGA